MKKLDLNAVPVREGTRYPEPFRAPCIGRKALLLSDAAGLSQFGVVMTRVAPGSWSSQRHWHEHEDEFVYVLEGEGVLVTDDSEEIFRAGDSAGFKAGDHNGHHFQNRSDKDFVYLVVGSRSDEDWADFPDIDLKTTPGRYSGKGGWARKNGDRY